MARFSQGIHSLSHNFQCEEKTMKVHVKLVVIAAALAAAGAVAAGDRVNSVTAPQPGFATPYYPFGYPASYYGPAYWDGPGYWGGPGYYPPGYWGGPGYFGPGYWGDPGYWSGRAFGPSYWDTPGTWRPWRPGRWW